MSQLILFNHTRLPVRIRHISNNSLTVIMIGLFLCSLFLGSLSSNHIEPLSGKQDIFGREMLLIFFDLHNSAHRKSVFYCQSLYTKFRSQKLDIIAISKENSSLEDLKLFYERNSLDFFLIQDSYNELQDTFEIMDCCGGFIYIDHSKIKHIFNNMLGPENLRQLIEKEITGKINYNQNFEGQILFKINQSVPNIELFPVDIDETLSFYDFKEDIIVVTFFSSICSTCDTGKRIINLIKLQEKQEIKDKK